MAVTFQQARGIVHERFAAHWKPEMGELITLPEGYENDAVFYVVAGAKEALVEGDWEYQLMDPPMLLVDKKTGEVSVANYLDDMATFDAMTPVTA